MANDYNEITNRLHSTREATDVSVNHIVSGADEVYDDVAPYRVNGHIECNDVTPTGTENPKELRWYEQVTYGSGQNTTTEWVRSNDITVDSGKTYGIPTGAKQSDINDQLYEMTGDTDKVVLYANEYEQITNPPVGTNPQANGWYELSGSTYILTTDTTIVSGKTYYARVAHISPDENKIANQQDGYIPTAGAVGRAMGANFEDNLQSTSTVKGLTANMGRVLNENKADINGYYETMSVGSAKNLDGETINSEAYLIRPTGGENNEVVSGLASVVGMEGNSAVWNQMWYVQNGSYSPTSIDTRPNCTIGIREYNDIGGTITKTIHWFTAQLSDVNIKHTTIITCTSSTNYIILYHNGYTRDITFPYITAAPSHKIFISFVLNSANVQTGISCSQMKAFDLTLLGIDNLTNLADVEAWLAEHVGTKHYYAYNPGTILSSNTLGFKTYSRNLLNPSDGLAKLIPYTHTTNSNKYTVKGIPTGAAVTYTPDNTGVAVDVTSAITDNTFDISSYGIGTLYIPNATADTYVCMKYDGAMDNEIVPYKENTYNFDVRNVYGKTGGSDEYVQCFPNGMRSVGDIKDTLTASEAKRSIEERDLSSIAGWYKDGVIVSREDVQHYIPTRGTTATVPAKIISNKYTFNNVNSTYSTKNGPDKSFSLIATSEASPFSELKLMVKDSSITATTDTGIRNALSGVYVIYVLTTPVTYTDLIYRDEVIDKPLREVLVNINVDNWSMEEQLITDYDNQGNPTSVPATIKTKYSIDAVEAIKTLEETTYTEAEVRATFSNLLDKINTNCSSILGGTFSIQNPTGKTLTFDFTANASTNSTEENTETI